jgi:ATP-dependent Clp endopeptidase proteolytic subunit ClpP
MRLLVTLLCLVFSPVVLGKEIMRSQPFEVVELSPDNLVRIVGEISESSASVFIQELYVVAAKSPTVTVFIDSPGGDVLAGIRMIDAVVGLKAVRPGVKLQCFAQTAASMAFIFFQTACDRRVVSSFSLLMSHQASLGVRGKAGEVESRLDLVRQLLTILDNRVAARLGLSVEDYRAKIVNDWWLVGSKGLDAQAADVLGVAACATELIASKTCPLSYAPPAP